MLTIVGVEEDTRGVSVVFVVLVVVGVDEEEKEGGGVSVRMVFCVSANGADRLFPVETGFGTDVSEDDDEGRGGGGGGDCSELADTHVIGCDSFSSLLLVLIDVFHSVYHFFQSLGTGLG